MDKNSLLFKLPLGVFLPLIVENMSHKNLKDGGKEIEYRRSQENTARIYCCHYFFFFFFKYYKTKNIEQTYFSQKGLCCIQTLMDFSQHPEELTLSKE